MIRPLIFLHRYPVACGVNGNSGYGLAGLADLSGTVGFVELQLGLATIPCWKVAVFAAGTVTTFRPLSREKSGCKSGCTVKNPAPKENDVSP